MILTNQAFRQSPRWTRETVTICAPGESPDTLPALLQAFRLWHRARRASAVVTMSPRVSLAYGLLCALTRRPSRQILCEVFLDDPRPSSLAWRVKTALFRHVARRALGVIVNSGPEIALTAARWRIPPSRIRFVPVCTTVDAPSAVPPASPPAVVCAGRTLRDLDTLFAAAHAIRAPVVLVTSAAQPLPSPVPANLTVLRELPLDDFRRTLSSAAVVVLPLLPAPRSTGQVVFLEAMSFAKPLVTTRAAGTVDYLRDRENALLVPPSDPAALAAAVNELLDDPALAARLGAAALADIRSRHSPDAHALARLTAVRELAGLPPSAPAGSP